MRRPKAQAWGLAAFGALLGLAWAAGFRSYMWHISAVPHVDWVGTFGAIVLPGVIVGALLGLAEGYRREGRRRLRWFALAPVAFAVAPMLLPGALSAFLTTGEGGGALGVAIFAILGGYALGAGRRWARIVTGILAVILLVGMTATVPLIGGRSLAFTTARGAWIAVLVASFLISRGSPGSRPARRPVAARSPRTPRASRGGRCHARARSQCVAG